MIMTPAFEGHRVPARRLLQECEPPASNRSTAAASSSSVSGFCAPNAATNRSPVAHVERTRNVSRCIPQNELDFAHGCLTVSRVLKSWSVDRKKLAASGTQQNAIDGTMNFEDLSRVIKSSMA